MDIHVECSRSPSEKTLNISPCHGISHGVIGFIQQMGTPFFSVVRILQSQGNNVLMNHTET